MRKNHRYANIAMIFPLRFDNSEFAMADSSTVRERRKRPLKSGAEVPDCGNEAACGARMEIGMQPTSIHCDKFKAPVGVLVVEDEDEQRGSLARQLVSSQNFDLFRIRHVAEAANSQSAEREITRATPDLVLLDYKLNGSELNGEELCRKLRRSGFTKPIIMLTAVGTNPESEKSLLRSGASDYMRKPFNMDVLLERINTQLTAYENSENSEVRIGEFTFRPAGNWLDHPEKRRIRLTSMESGILRFLYKARGSVVEKRMLLEQVWNYNPEVATHTLETHIYRLRQKIEREPKNPAIILTSSGGYRLSC